MTHPDPKARRQLDALAEGVRRLVPAAIGTYLHGSTSSGRLQRQSDLDVLVVTAEPLAPVERGALTGFVLDLSGRYPREPDAPRPIELTVVAQGDVRPWRYPPRCDLLYGEWLRPEVEGGKPLTPFTCPDLAILLAMVIQADAVLFGPSATEVLDRVPVSDLVRASVDGLPGLVDDLESDTTNVLLTLARAWRTCATGDLVAKDAAAEWAMIRSEATVADILARARGVYLGAEEPDWSTRFLSVRPVADRLLQEITTAAGEG